MEKAYINEKGVFSNPLEVANWLYNTVRRKYHTGSYLNEYETRELIVLLQKRYEIEYYTDSERLLAGLAYYKEVVSKYNFEFVRNFGQYYFFIEKKSLSGVTKKADTKSIGYDGDLIITIKKDVKRSSDTIRNEHEQMICAFSMRQQPGNPTAYWSNHLSGANLDELKELKKKLDRKIKDWGKADSVSIDDFFLFIAIELKLRASKKNDNHFSYYVSVIESDEKITLRISDHHYDASTDDYHRSKHTTSLTFSNEETEEWDYFKPNENTKAIEYVYYEKDLSKNDFIAIAKDVISFIDTGKFNPSVDPKEINKSPRKQMKGIGELSNTDKLDDLAETQYRNRMKARIPDIDDYTLDEVTGKIYKENEYTHIRYTKNDFFQVDPDNLKRVHEFIMYMKEFFVKKTHWWLDILRLDADGYPIYIDFNGALVFIETYKQYKDEWKKDFFYGDSVDYFVKSQYVMSHGDNDFSSIIMKLNHKPSVKAICDFIEKTAKKNEFSEKFIKELKEHIEKMDSDAIINKMINAYKRAFSPAKPSVPVVSDLYKYLDKSKLPNGEYIRTYSGIYYDDGYAVTTDGRFIFAHKKFYDKRNEGKIIDEIGKEIDGKYPNWRHFLLNESDKLKKLDIDRDELYKQILMYDKAYRYRDHKAPIEYFSIKDGDKIYPYSAKLLKGFLHQSMAYTNVSFYVSVSTNEYNRLNNMLIMKSDEGSYGIAAQLGTDNHQEMLDEVNSYGMMRDFGAEGYPFILYSVYEIGKHSKEKTKPNNIQLAKAKMKMAAARLKMMNMSLGEITYEMD